MSVGFALSAGGGAQAVGGSGAADMGFSQVVPPQMARPEGANLAGLGTTWVVAGAFVVLALIYAHWHTY
jgi:hypothetical protein